MVYCKRLFSFLCLYAQSVQVVTGIMRLAPDAAARQVPIGVLPTGSNNVFFSNNSVYTDRLLVSLPPRCQSSHRKLMKTALAIVKSGRTKHVDVLEIQPSLSHKPSYALVCEPC